MNISDRLWVVAALLLQVQVSFAKRDKSLYCSICRALVDEVKARIDDVDPKKKVKVGSFRVDPDGNQKLVEKLYAKSDVHLTEVFDNVCDTMDDYALTQSPAGKLGVVRIKSRTGEDLDTSNIGFNKNLRQTFKGYCDSMIDDFEDEMMGLFKLDHLHSVESELCGEIAQACTEEDLSQPFKKLEKRRERTMKSLHDLEPKEEVEEIQADDNIEENIVEPASPDSKKKAKNASEKEEL